MNKTAIIDGVEYNLVPVEKEVYKWGQRTFGDFYWIVQCNGLVVKLIDGLSDSDNFAYLTGNYFRTKEQAEQYKLLLEAKGRVRLKALELGGGEGIDWRDEVSTKHTFSFCNGWVRGDAILSCLTHPEKYFYWADLTKRDEFLVACKEDLEFIYNYNYLI